MTDSIVVNRCRACKARNAPRLHNGYLDLYCRDCRNKDLACALDGVESVGGRGQTKHFGDWVDEPKKIREGLKWLFGCRARLPHHHPIRKRCHDAIMVLVEDLIPEAKKAYQLAEEVVANRSRSAAGLPDDDEEL